MIAVGLEHPTLRGIDTSDDTRYYTNTGGRARTACPGACPKPVRACYRFLRAVQPPATLMRTFWWAWGVTHDNPTHKAVLLALAAHDGSKGCFPSISRLAAGTSLGRSTIIRSIVQMEELGLIHAVRERGKSTKYLFNKAWVGSAAAALVGSAASEPVTSAANVLVMRPVGSAAAAPYQRKKGHQQKEGFLDD